MKAFALKAIIFLLAVQPVTVVMAKSKKAPTNPEQSSAQYFTPDVVDKLWNILDMIPGVNKRVMGIMLQVHHEIQKMLDGDSLNNHAGIYVFEGKNYSVVELMRLEQELLEQLTRGADKESTRKLSLLKNCLNDAKKDFDAKLSKFLGLAHQAKDCLLILIKESCEKHNRSSSFLLSWGNVADENDMKSFYENIKTFHDHHEFLSDLLNFMKDLINRSPRAKAEFMELVKRSKENKKITAT